jgi:transcriptional regulator with XRE-family HTH domain
MVARYGKENLTRLAADCHFGPGTATRLKEQRTSVGLDVIDQIAVAFQVDPWQLLVPGMNPSNPPVLRQANDAERELYKRLLQVAKDLSSLDPK